LRLRRARKLGIVPSLTDLAKIRHSTILRKTGKFDNVS
jgi:hypothetical protein